MKHLFSILLLVFALEAVAQKESFDLATYTPPAGWKKEKTENAVQFVHADTSTGTWCVITLLKAIPGLPSARANFDSAWESVVKGSVTVSEKPVMLPAASEDGWELQSGYAPFELDGEKGAVVLVTATGFEKMVNAMVLTNSDSYEKNIAGFLESITLKKPESLPPPMPAAANAAVLGTWVKTSSSQSAYDQRNGIATAITYQYTFRDDGTYSFYSKTFGMTLNSILLVRETGNYRVAGDRITIDAKKSVIESWSKKDNVDQWGKRLSVQNRALEKMTYEFHKEYFSGIQSWNLIMKPSKPTARDGAPSIGGPAGNAYYFDSISANKPAIVLPTQ